MSRDKICEALEAARRALWNEWHNRPRIDAEDAVAKIDAALSALAAAPEVERLRELVEAFVAQAEVAIRHHESKGNGGMQVPYHGDFANVPPSVVVQLRRWVRDFREALTPPPQPKPAAPEVPAATIEGAGVREPPALVDATNAPPFWSLHHRVGCSYWNDTAKCSCGAPERASAELDSRGVRPCGILTTAQGTDGNPAAGFGCAPPTLGATPAPSKPSGEAENTLGQSLERECPVCRSPPGVSCTSINGTSRGNHAARTALATPAPTPEAAQAPTREGDCPGCGRHIGNHVNSQCLAAANAELAKVRLQLAADEAAAGDALCWARFLRVPENLKPSRAVAALVEKYQKANEERRNLARFKAYVHKRLDDAGVPTHPDGEHSKAGCRIGDRLDLLIGARDAAEKRAEELERGLKLAQSLADDVDMGPRGSPDDEWRIPWSRHAVEVFAEIARILSAAPGETGVGA